MKKRIISLLLVLSMLFTLMPAMSLASFAEEPPEEPTVSAEPARQTTEEPTEQPESWEDWEWFKNTAIDTTYNPQETYYKVYKETYLPYGAYDVSAAGDGSVMAQIFKDSDGNYTLVISGEGTMSKPWQSGVGGSANGIKSGRSYISLNGYQNLTALIVEDGVEVIGVSCLQQLYCVQNATFEGDIAIKDKAVMDIGKNSANGLSITFNGIVDEIGYWAFRAAGCYAGSKTRTDSGAPTATVSVLFKEKVYSIGEKAFEAMGQGCGLDLYVTAMKDVEEIGSYAFKDAGSNCKTSSIKDKVNKSWLSDSALSYSATYDFPSSSVYNQYKDSDTNTKEMQWMYCFLKVREGYYAALKQVADNAYKTSVKLNFMGTVGYIGTGAFQYVGKCVRDLSINKKYATYLGLDSTYGLSSYAFVGESAEITLRSTMDKIPDSCFYGFGQGCKTVKLYLDFPNATEIGAQAFYQTFLAGSGEYQPNLSGIDTESRSYSNQAVGSDVNYTIKTNTREPKEGPKSYTIPVVLGTARLFDIEWKQADGSYSKVLPESFTSFGQEAFYTSGYDPGRTLTKIDQYGANAFDLCYKEKTLKNIDVSKLSIVDSSTVNSTVASINNGISVKIVPADSARSAGSLRHGQLLTFELTNNSNIPNNQLFYKVTIQKGSGSSVSKLVYFDGFDMYEYQDGYESEDYFSVLDQKYFSAYEGSGNKLTVEVYRATKSGVDASPFNLTKVASCTANLSEDNLRAEIDGNSLMMFKSGGSALVNKLLGRTGVTHIDNETTCFQVSNTTGTNVVFGDATPAETDVAWVNSKGLIAPLRVGSADITYDVYSSNCIYHGTEDVKNVQATIYVFADPVATASTITLNHSAGDSGMAWLGELSAWSVSVGDGEFVALEESNVFSELTPATAYRVVYRHNVSDDPHDPIYQYLYTTVRTKTPVISFNLMGGTKDGSETVADITSATIPTGMGRPKKAKLLFTGWYYDEGCTQKAMIGDEISAEQITLYAGWAKRPYTPAVSTKNYTYGNPNNDDVLPKLINPKTSDGQTFSWYYGTDKNNISTDLPDAEGMNALNAGTYYLKVVTSGATSYEDAELITTFTVAKATPDLSAFGFNKYKQGTATLNTVADTYGAVSYALYKGETAPQSTDGLTWQDSNIFENLELDTQYYFYVSVAGNENYIPLTSAPVSFKTPDHEHLWVYTLSTVNTENDTVTVSCTGSGVTAEKPCTWEEDNRTVTISAADADYDTKPHGAELTKNTIASLGDDNFPAIYYRAKNSAEEALSQTVPTQPGTYVASISFTDENNDVTIAYTEYTIAAHDHIKGENTTVFDMPQYSAFAGGTLTSGNYYLKSDVTLTEDIVIPADENVILCLNGHVLNLNGQHQIDVKGTFTLCDCALEGARTHKFDKTNARWALSDSGTEEITGGVITGGVQDESTQKASIYGGAVYVEANAVFNMEGGSIVGNEVIAGNDAEKKTNGVSGLSAMGGAVYAEGEFNLSGGALLGNCVSGNSGGEADNIGGAVYVSASGTLNMTGGKIAYNLAKGAEGTECLGGGGGIFVMSGTGNITGGTIENNSSDYLGGGAVVQFGKLNITSTDQSPVELKNNKAQLGAALGSYNGEVNINGAKINNNEASSSGGAIALVAVSKAKIENAQINNNKAEEYGGAYYINNSEAELTGGTVSENKAYNAGAIYSKASELTVEGASITKNTADAYGGAILANENTSLELKGSTLISENKAYYGGGIVLRYSPMSMGGTVSITANSAEHFAGVLTQGNTSKLSLSGAPVVSGNKINLRDTTIMTEENLYLCEGGLVSIVEGGLSENADIRFSIDKLPTNGDPVVIATNGGDYASRFKDDENGIKYGPKADNGRICLVDSEIHNWSYNVSSSDPATINAVCSIADCTSSAKTLSLTAPKNLAYDGEAKKVTLSAAVIGGETVSDEDIVYYSVKNNIETALDDGTYPTAVGDYVAKLTVQGAEAKLNFSILPLAVTLSVDGKEDRYFDSLSLALNAMSKAKEKTGKLTLNQNLADNVTVPEGFDITLDLKGNVLYGKAAGTIITNNGTLEIKSSASTPHNYYFDLTSGLIVICEGGEYEFEGGVITRAGGSSGAVVNNGTMSIFDTAVIGNSSEYGVVNNADMSASGVCLIKGNRAANLYLASGKTVDASGLNSDSFIAVTTQVAPAEDMIPITGDNGKDQRTLFTSDNISYKLLNSGNIVYLAAKEPVAIIVDTGATYTLVQAAINAADDNQTVKMLADSVENISVSGKTLSLDLNGMVLYAEKPGTNAVSLADVSVLTLIDSASAAKHTGSYSSLPDGGVITGAAKAIGVSIGDQSQFNMNGGTVTGNNQGVNNEGIFNMNDGATISGNIKTSDYINGVAVYNKGSFTMSGGSIKDNKAAYEVTYSRIYGGGVYNNGTFTMTGGSITGNSLNADTAQGGGVYANYNDGQATMKVGGTAIITGNKCNNAVNNVYISGSVSVIDSADLSMSIGVSRLGGGQVTQESSGDYAQYFTSDDPDYYVKNNTTDGASKQYLRLVKLTGKVFNVNTGVFSDTIAAALSNSKFSNGNTLKLMQDLTENVVIPEGTTVTIDLNGFVMKQTGNPNPQEAYNAGDKTSNHSVITNKGTLTVIDSDKTKEHYFTVESNGLWKLTDTNTSDTKTVYGGVITGGMGTIISKEDTVDFGGGGIFNTGVLTLEGGTVCGNDMSFSNVLNPPSASDYYSLGGGIYSSGESASLTVSGAVICGNRCDGSGGGVCLGNNSEFTMSGGVISDNTANTGGGVCVKDARFTLNNGSIKNNTASSDFGGGVHNTGCFVMNGGSITGNRASLGGSGVFSEKSEKYNTEFTMTGGSITGNSSDNRTGGVYCTNVFTVSGDVKITGNKLAGKECNVYERVRDEKTNLITIGTAGLTDDAKIGVTFEGGTGAVTTSNGANDYAQYFFSDNAAYEPEDVLDSGSGTDKHVELIASKIAEVLDGSGAHKEYYSTVQAAIDAALNGETVRMLKNSTENVRIESDDEVTLDLNGFVLKGDGTTSVVTNNGTLTIKDSEPNTVHYLADLKCSHGVAIGNSCDGCRKCEHGCTAAQYCWQCDIAAGSGYNGPVLTGTGIAEADSCYETLYSAKPASGEYLEVTGGCITGGIGTLKIEDDDSSLSGGGVYNSGNLTLESGSILGNSALKYGGGVYISNNCEFLMNGGAISNNAANSTGGGVYVDDGARFTMNGGAIENNTANEGGGVCVEENAEFIMANASIKNNTARTEFGGGVSNRGKFLMNGGSITGNRAYLGGSGVFSEGESEFTMTGGSITGNSSDNRTGGVYCYNGFTVSGNAKITGNTLAGKEFNVYERVGFDDHDQPITNLITIGTGGLTGDAKIGVTFEDGEGTVTTENGENDYRRFFTSDEGYLVALGENNAIILLGAHQHQWTYSLKGTDTIEASCNNPCCDYLGGDYSITISFDEGLGKAILSARSLAGAASLPNIMYKSLDVAVADESSDVPTVFGNYRASITIGDKTASVDFSISHEHVWNYSVPNNAADTFKAACISSGGHVFSKNVVTEISILPPDSEGGLTYDKTAKEASFSEESIAGRESMPEIKYEKLNSEGNYEAIDGKPVDAGTYRAYVKMLDTSELIADDFNTTLLKNYVTAKSQDFTIEQAANEASLSSYDDIEVTYGETITLPTVITLEGVEAPEPTYTDSDGNTVTELKDAGSYTVTWQVDGGGNYKPVTLSINVKINPKQLAVAGSTVASRAYDETKDISVSLGTISGFEYDDTAEMVTVTASGTMADADVGSNKAVEVVYAITGGTKAANYAAPEKESKTVNISKADQTIEKPSAQEANIGVYDITLDTIDSTKGYGTVMYYKTTTAGSAPKENASGWQESNVFSNLKMNTNYYFYAKYSGDKNHNYVISGVTKIRTLNHYHVWEYTVNDDGDTITVTCSGPGNNVCNKLDNRPRVIKITPDYLSVVYDGTSHGATLTETDLAGIERKNFPIIKYVGINETVYTESAKAPTDAGDYRASITVVYGDDMDKSVTAYTDFTIEKADMQDVSVKQKTELIYSAFEQSAEVTAEATTVNNQPTTFTYCAAEDGEYTETVPAFKNAGTYTVYFKVTAPNHNDASGEFEVTIDPKSISEGKAYVTLAGQALYATGAKQTQAIESVLMPDWTDPITYNTSDAAKTDAGIYSLTVTGYGNYCDSVTKTFVILDDPTVNPAPIVPGFGKENIDMVGLDGRLTLEFINDSDAPAAQINTPRSKTISAIVTAEELSQVADGRSLDITIRVRGESSVPTASQDVLKAVLTSGDQHTSFYYGIDIQKQLSAESAQKLSRVANDLSYTLTFPEEYRLDNRAYCTALYNGTSTSIIRPQSYDNSSGSFTFDSSETGDYAIGLQLISTELENRPYSLYIDDHYVGIVIIEPESGGYYIRLNGQYIGRDGTNIINSKQLWSFSDSKLYQKTTEDVSRGWTILNYIFGMKKAEKTYYLSYQNGLAINTTGDNSHAELREAPADEHIYEWVSDGNGHHYKTCISCGRHSGEVGDCVYADNGLCKYCGAPRITSSGVFKINVKVYTTNLLFFKIYTATATVNSDVVAVKSYEIANGSSNDYTTGKITSTSKINDVMIRISTYDGGVYYYCYDVADGVISPVY